MHRITYTLLRTSHFIFYASLKCANIISKWYSDPRLYQSNTNQVINGTHN